MDEWIDPGSIDYLKDVLESNKDYKAFRLPRLQYPVLLVHGMGQGRQIHKLLGRIPEKLVENGCQVVQLPQNCHRQFKQRNITLQRGGHAKKNIIQ